jgi:outer membrane protein assembly factor BamD (BamD/ComL family)
MFKSARTVSIVLISLCLVAVSCKKGESQEELYKRAMLSQEQSDFKGAITAYEEYVRRFPKSPDAPKCLFMVGYLYSNHLNDLVKGREAYEKFIRTFPEDKLIKDAQWELDHLGMDVNQIDELNKVIGTKDSAATSQATGQ